jgi:hypothetical protein
MFEEPEESPEEAALSADDRVKDKTDEFRMAAELFAVFEATRKFDAQIRPDLDAELAREIQRTMGRLEKAKTPDSPMLPEGSAADAAAILDMANARDLPSNDYYVHRRPGEVIIVRWLLGEQVETFYERLQAHFDAAMEGFREEERQQQAWKQDPKTLAFLDALDKVEVKMADRYLRPLIRTHNLYVLSTQSADELNINYLADYVMSVPAAEIVGSASAPPDDAPTERDLAWFFRLFSLRGIKEGVEQMCFFAFLQKSDDDAW